MWCIGFIEQWPLDHAKVLYTSKSMSMVQSQKGGLHTPGHKEETSKETHMSPMLEVFGVLPEKLEVVGCREDGQALIRIWLSRKAEEDRTDFFF